MRRERPRLRTTQRIGACVVGLAVALVIATEATAGPADAVRAQATVPPQVGTKIAALFGPTAYVPSWLPPGFIFISWKPQPPSGPHGGTPYGRFTITFAHAGKILDWIVDGPADAYDCTTPYRPAKSTTIRGRQINYVNGNHGDSAFTCLGTKAAPWEISTWTAHALSPATVMEIVGRFRTARQ